MNDKCKKTKGHIWHFLILPVLIIFIIVQINDMLQRNALISSHSDPLIYYAGTNKFFCVMEPIHGSKHKLRISKKIYKYQGIDSFGYEEYAVPEISVKDVKNIIIDLEKVDFSTQPYFKTNPYSVMLDEDTCKKMGIDAAALFEACRDEYELSNVKSEYNSWRPVYLLGKLSSRNKFIVWDDLLFHLSIRKSGKILGVYNFSGVPVEIIKNTEYQTESEWINYDKELNSPQYCFDSDNNILYACYKDGKGIFVRAYGNSE